MEKINFLNYVFTRQCSPGDYFFLSAKPKKGKGWVDHPIKYKKTTFKKEVETFFRLYPEESYDLYFSPMSYSKPRRLIAYGNTTKFLSQDIDENYTPSKKTRPSLLWESSPGKYQGLWELDREVEIESFNLYNKALATKIGADDCYDFTHVFRIPGTLNHKYKAVPRVSEASIDKPVKLYRVPKLKELLTIKTAPKTAKKSKEKLTGSLSERIIYAKYNIPQDIKNYLASPQLEEGWDRSRIIWYIENKLNELGMEPGEIITLIKGSVFNKYKGRHDEDKRLKAELMKILANKAVDEEVEPLRFTSYQGVMGSLRTFEGWMVKGIWGRKSHGIVAGMPKTFKSTLVQDLAVSVASGKPFLNKYEVLESGPVIIIQNENADYIMKDRTEKMITNKGLVGDFQQTGDNLGTVKWAPDLPLYFVNQEGFTLSDEKKKRSLEKLIEQVKPVLVIFDPLYLMFDGDINKAEDLNPALNWLLGLKNKYNTSIMLLHHYNKGSGDKSDKGGSRMSGSIFLYGWIESAWYLTKEDADYTGDEEDEFKSSTAVVELRREFRMAGQYPDLNISLDMGEIGDPYYKVGVQVSQGDAPTKKKGIVDSVSKLQSFMEPDKLYTKRDLTKGTYLSRKQVTESLNELYKEHLIEIVDGEYRILN